MPTYEYATMRVRRYISIDYGGEKGCRYENFSVQIIDQVEEGDKVALAEKEVYWQNQLRCYVQNGGHAHCYRKEK